MYLLTIALAVMGLGLINGWAAEQWGGFAPHRANLPGHPLSFAAVAAGALQTICTILSLVLAGWASHSRRSTPFSPQDLRLLIQVDAEIVTLRGRMAVTPSPPRIKSSQWARVRD